MLPTTGKPPLRHSRGVGGAGGPPTPSLLLVTMLLGFSTGIMSGFLYQRHRQIGDVVPPDADHPASRAGFVSNAPVATAATTPSAAAAAPATMPIAPQIVRHDFSSSSGGGGGGGSSSSSSQTTTTAAAAAAAATPAASSSSGSSGGGGPVVRTSTYSSSSKTGLTRADAARVSKALADAGAKHAGDTIHTLFTSNGSPYQNIQGRIMYASYKLVQAMPGGEKLTGFTRILHRTTDDPVVGEIPTFRAYPLQPECDTWCEFPVKDRANAVVQWLLAAERDPSMVKGAWLLMLESDYVWRVPARAPGSAHDARVPGLAFVYDYINPAYPTVAPSIREMCPQCDPEKVPRSGPAPVMLRPAELARAAPDWEAFSAWIEGNELARKNLDWVREMYAWCVAVTVNNISITHEAPPSSRLLAQPPHDLQPGPAAIYHYTWGSIYKDGEREAWRFDKRDYTAEADALKLPHFPPPPQPWREGAWKLQDGLLIGRELHETLTDMLNLINRAVDTLPDLSSPASRPAAKKRRRG